MAKGILRWVGDNARPISERWQRGARETGETVGLGVKYGSGAFGAGVVGVGLLAVGGPAGLGVATVGAGIGVTGLAGSWISGKVGQGLGWGFNVAGKTCLRFVRLCVCGVQSSFCTGM